MKCINKVWIKIICILVIAGFLIPSLVVNGEYHKTIIKISTTSYSNEERERWALLIVHSPGIAYPTKIKNCLIHHGWKEEHIKILYYPNGITTGDIRTAITVWLKERTAKEDIVFLHSEGDGGIGFLIIGDPRYEHDELSYSTLGKWLDQLEVKGIFYSITACHSGSAISALGRNGRVIITACRTDEYAGPIDTFLYEEDDEAGRWGFDAPVPNGAFARVDCDLNGDGWVSAEEAYAYAEGWTINFSQFLHDTLDWYTWVSHPQIYDRCEGELNIANISEKKPHTPSRPSGPIKGRVGIIYNYSASATDPWGQELYYMFDWGDGNTSGWFGPYSSGEEISASHAWSEQGNYSVKVKAMDAHGTESEWSDSLIVSIQPYINIQSVSGGLTISAVIANIGDEDIFNIRWSVNINGMIFLGNHTEGVIPILEVGKTKIIGNVLVFGMGPATVTITADEASLQRKCFVLGPIVII